MIHIFHSFTFHCKFCRAIYRGSTLLCLFHFLLTQFNSFYHLFFLTSFEYFAFNFTSLQFIFYFYLNRYHSASHRRTDYCSCRYVLHVPTTVTTWTLFLQCSPSLLMTHSIISSLDFIVVPLTFVIHAYLLHTYLLIPDCSFF